MVPRRSWPRPDSRPFRARSLRDNLCRQLRNDIGRYYSGWQPGPVNEPDFPESGHLPIPTIHPVGSNRHQILRPCRRWVQSQYFHCDNNLSGHCRRRAPPKITATTFRFQFQFRRSTILAGCYAGARHSAARWDNHKESGHSLIRPSSRPDHGRATWRHLLRNR